MESTELPDYSHVVSDWCQVVAGCVTILIMFVGLSGNVLTIIALWKYPRIRNVTATFIMSLCVADALFCAIVLPFNAYRFFGSQLFKEHSLLCQLIPYLQYGNVGLSLLFIAMITINRYVMIAHYSVYNKIYRPINVAAMIVFCLVLSFGMQVPTLLGEWGEYKYHDTLNMCTISTDVNGHSAKTFLFIFAFFIPCVVIICCYTCIFWVVRRSEQRIKGHAQNTHPSSLSPDVPVTKESKRKRNEWRITKMVLAIFLSFLICYLPITLVKVFDNDVNQIYLHLISYIMLYLSACINPIIYVIMNKQYRKAYGSVIVCKPASVFNISTGKPKEPPSKTVISHMSVSMIPMSPVDNQKVDNGS